MRSRGVNRNCPKTGGDGREVVLTYSCFMDKITGFTCGNGRLIDFSASFLPNGITEPVELWYHLGGENKAFLYWDSVFIQWNELQGQRYELMNYNLIVRFGELIMDHVAAKNVLFIGNEDPYSYHPRCHWRLTRIGGPSESIHFEMSWIPKIWKWSVANHQWYHALFVEVNGKPPTKTTVKERRKSQQLVCAAIPTKEPLICNSNYDRINLELCNYKLCAMHDSLYLIWYPFDAVMEHLPNCLASKQIIALISGLNPG
eukprot:869534_1